jgi:hypothetical protein
VRPRSNRVRAQPASDRHARNLRHDAWHQHVSAQLGAAETRQ